jgi:hypothetical protein
MMDLKLILVDALLLVVDGLPTACLIGREISLAVDQ